MRNKRVAFVGAGYIADWHRAALRYTDCAELVAICDQSASAVARFCEPNPSISRYASVARLLDGADCDAVHVLTGPDSHYAIARAVLESGRHAFVEKPLALTASQCHDLNEVAAKKSVKVGVNQNFLWLPAYGALRDAVRGGSALHIDNAVIEWQLPFPALRSGPYDIWPLASQRNFLFEILPHPFAFALDLFGSLDVVSAQSDHPIELPTRIRHHQRHTVLARSGSTAVVIIVCFVEGVEARQISVRGLGFNAVFDYGNDVFVREHSSAGPIVVGAMAREAKMAASRLAAAGRNAWRQLTSANRLSPFGLSIARSVDAFHCNTALDERHSPVLAADIATAIDHVASNLETRGALVA